MLVVSLFSASFLLAQEEVPSPEKYLGYRLGERFTPHAKVFAYVKTVADRSDRVLYRSYGETFEGRELGILIISDPANLARIEEIRAQNLRLTDPRRISEGEAAKIIRENPGIVWLSYNVHGNESCSSEAAMKVLYRLATAQDDSTREWLKRLVIIMDPMLNPDGRDRYVNWYNSVVGAQPNPDPLAVEHREPWPGGRGNHYLFDLNRDWAWAVQKESRLRIQEYHRWMPQVHVDFHEMGYTSTYFFFPPSRPVNPLFPEQVHRWAEIFGKGNATYFDREGIPYFTGESFDLFYPGYGDCYPTFNGATGMTYEQGGGGFAGLRIRRPDKTELTLKDRLHGHYLASLATIQTAAQHREERLRDFFRFFQSALNYRDPQRPRWVFLDRRNDPALLEALVELLRFHRIEVAVLEKPARVQAVAYGESVARSRRFPEGTLVVDLNQPMGYLARALLEPEAQKPDTLFFYDITSWSLPYALNLKAFWAKKAGGLQINRQFDLPKPEVPDISPARVGYLVPWGQIRAIRFLAQCFGEGIRVRIAHRPFVYGGRKFGRGSLVILNRDNRDKKNLVGLLQKISRETGVAVFSAQSGMTESGIDLGSNYVRPLKKPKVLLLRDRPASFTSVGAVWFLFEQVYGFPLTLINADLLKSVRFEDYNVLILPSSYGRGGGIRSVLDSAAVERLKKWIRDGGVLITMGGSAGFATADGAKLVDVAVKKEKRKGKKKDKKEELSPEEIAERKRTVAERELERWKERVPGTIMRILLDQTHPLAYGMPRQAFVLKRGRQVFELGKKGYNVALFPEKDARITGYLSEKNVRLIRGGVYLYEQRLGRGHVVLFADEPNFRGFWRGLDLLLCNAVFFLPSW
jgi:hypothetical protein